MTLPNVSVPLVDENGIPTRALVGALPGLSATDAVVDENGMATPLFRRALQGMTRRPLPNPSVQLTNDDGTPTRAMTALLMGVTR